MLAHPLLRDAIDWIKPVAVLMFAVLHFIADDAEAGGSCAPYRPGRARQLPGHLPRRLRPRRPGGAAERGPGLREAHRRPVQPRAAEQVAPWLDGLEIMPPGLVNVDVWLPSLRVGGNPAPPSLGVLARKNATAAN